MNAAIAVFTLLLAVIGLGLVINVVISRVVNRRIDESVADQFSIMRRRNKINKRVLTNYTRR